jgi:hypothetical protein
VLKTQLSCHHDEGTRLCARGVGATYTFVFLCNQLQSDFVLRLCWPELGQKNRHYTNNAVVSVNAFHEKAGQCQEGSSWFLFVTCSLGRGHCRALNMWGGYMRRAVPQDTM